VQTCAALDRIEDDGMVTASLPRARSWVLAARLLSLIPIAAGFQLLSSAAIAQDAGPPAFSKCLACHAIGAEAQNKNGPVLNGVAAKPVASVDGFVYSEAFQAAKAAGLVWTDENLDKYLADPIGFMPGSRMAWAVQDAGERAAIIAYLKTLQ
jgi:cytochrome c